MTHLDFRKCAECGAEFIGPNAELALKAHRHSKLEQILTDLISDVLKEINCKQAEVNLLIDKKSILQEALNKLIELRENKTNAV